MPKGEIAIVIGSQEIRDTARKFRAIATRQYPFAVARALTQTAKDASESVARQLPRSFKVRNRGLGRAITFDRASKNDRPPTAYVGTRPWAEFLTLHAEGGTRKGKHGHRIAVPTRIVKRGASGRVPKRHQPRTLRRRKGFRPEELERAKRIAVRGKTKRAGSLGIYFLLRNRVKIRKTWPLRDQVERTAAQVFPARFRLSFRQALESAR